MFLNISQKDFYEIEDEIYNEGKSAVVIFSSNRNNKSDEIINRLMSFSNTTTIPIYNINYDEAEGLAGTYSIFESDIPSVLLFADGDIVKRFDNTNTKYICDIIDSINDL